MLLCSKEEPGSLLKQSNSPLGKYLRKDNNEQKDKPNNNQENEQENIHH